MFDLWCNPFLPFSHSFLYHSIKSRDRAEDCRRRQKKQTSNNETLQGQRQPNPPAATTQHPSANRQPPTNTTHTFQQQNNSIDRYTYHSTHHATDSKDPKGGEILHQCWGKQHHGRGQNHHCECLIPTVLQRRPDVHCVHYDPVNVWRLFVYDTRTVAMPRTPITLQSNLNCVW